MDGDDGMDPLDALVAFLEQLHKRDYLFDAVAVANKKQLGESLHLDGQDDRSSLRHHPRSPQTSFLCLDSSVSYVLNQHTPSDTAETRGANESCARLFAWS